MEPPIKFNYSLLDIENSEIKAENEKQSNASKENGYSKNLKTIIASYEKLKITKSTEVKFSQAVILQGENPVIYPNTINVIQGQAGVHKSRVAETICASLMKKHGCENELLGFKRNSFENRYTVVYVDTERNLSEQLPYALQSIQIKAGYKIEEHPSDFLYISLLQISRKERFSTLNEYLELLRKTINTPLFVVLDVSTDCIEDFNKTDKSMELIDSMNMIINEHNVIFLCLIHENPKSDKARGHFGTELMNKASTQMQVGFEKDAKNNDTEIIRVKYLKCRSNARFAPFYFKYCSEAKGLVLADESEIDAVKDSRKHKANSDDIIDFLEKILGDGSELQRRVLLSKLMESFEASQRTIDTRIAELIDSERVIINQKGDYCKLTKVGVDKSIYYKLIPNEVV